MVQFYKEVCAVLGVAPDGITGHSARVAGAQRMAVAGHPAWTIQVFGRWGSAAVLGYVREAILGLQGGQLAQVTEARSVTIAGLAQSVRKAGKDKLFRRGRRRRDVAIEAATESFVAGRRVLEPPAEAFTEDSVGRVLARVREIEEGLRVLSGEACPQYVKCPGRLMHRVFASTCTARGCP